MKPEYDFHIHTVLSGHADARQDVDTIVKTAENAGLRAIAVTEHISKAEDIKRISIIRSQVNNLKTSCKIYVGAEIDVDPYSDDGSLVIDRFDDLDLVIGAIHYFPGTQILPHGQQVPDCLKKNALVKWRQMLLGLAANPELDILAHPGIMIANAIFTDRWISPALKVFEEAACISKQTGTAWEINELTAKKLSPPLRENYWQIFSIAAEAGVELVYGSDAHRPEDIGSCFFANKIALQAGYSNLFEYTIKKSHLKSNKLDNKEILCR